MKLPDKDTIKRLYLHTLKGITKQEYSSLSELERSCLSLTSGRYVLKPECRSHIKVVLTGGVFDVIHLGHVFILEKAKQLGDVLIVVVAKDKFIQEKNRKPVHSQAYRLKLVSSVKYVDLALPGQEDVKRVVSLVSPDIIVYGYDQKPFLKPKGVKIVHISERFEEEKLQTTKILEKLGW